MIVLDVTAGQIAEELARRGIPPTAVVHARIELVDDAELPMGAIAESGKAFDWLAEEPDLYSDNDLIAPPR